MNKSQFLETLSQQLTGEIPTNEIYSNINYYSQYIDQEIASGKSEAEVLDALGDPHLIAKTLIDADVAPYRSGTEYEDVVYEETADGRACSDSTSHEESHYDNTSQQETTESRKVYRLDLSTWYGKAILIAVAVVIIALLVTVVSALLPFVLILVVIGIVISYFKRR